MVVALRDETVAESRDAGDNCRHGVAIPAHRRRPAGKRHRDHSLGTCAFPRGNAADHACGAAERDNRGNPRDAAIPADFPPTGGGGEISAGYESGDSRGREHAIGGKRFADQRAFTGVGADRVDAVSRGSGSVAVVGGRGGSPRNAPYDRRDSGAHEFRTDVADHGVAVGAERGNGVGAVLEAGGVAGGGVAAGAGRRRVGGRVGSRGVEWVCDAGGGEGGIVAWRFVEGTFTIFGFFKGIVISFPFTEDFLITC